MENLFVWRFGPVRSSIIFMPLSYADLKWNEMAFKINKLHKLDLSEEDIEKLNYYDSVVC